jgi:vacuolar-type H+-ATPase subunit E/Vma4
METKPIIVRVNVEAARIFETAPEEERRKIEALLSLKLTQATREKRTLEEVMSDISQKAQERGLTPEILDSILNEQ